jgi:hypothetical protein
MITVRSKADRYGPSATESVLSLNGAENKSEILRLGAVGKVHGCRKVLYRGLNILTEKYKDSCFNGCLFRFPRGIQNNNARLTCSRISLTNWVRMERAISGEDW